MLTKTAEIDLKALRDGGFKPSDSEIVLLNDLAKRIEAGRDVTPASMPRIAFAGNVVLHEPTIASEMWWIDYGSDAFFTDKWRLRTYFFMLYNAQNENLPKLQDKNEIRKAVKKFCSECTATESELWRALMWVKCGDSQGVSEMNKAIRSSLDDEESRNALWMTLIAAAGATGISPDKLETKTVSELNGMLVQANMMARIPMKASVAKDYMAYRQIIRQIEDRGNG